MSRPARALLALLSIVTLGACKKPVAGEPCKTENKQLCADKSSSIVCVDGKWEPLACRGVTGCKTLGDDVSCSNEAFAAGEPCDPTTDNFQCTPDKKGMVQCAGKHWKLVDACLGPDACAQKGGQVSCDDTLSELDAPCYPEGDHACSADGKQMYACSGGKMAPALQCRGARGCAKAGEEIACDDSVAKPGDPCMTDGNPACSVDKKSMLKCKSKQMVDDKKCKGGCNVLPGTIECN